MELLVTLFLIIFNNSILLMFGLILFLLLGCVILVYFVNSYFYSFLVFMLFMRGVIVLFLYICGIVMIEKINFCFKRFVGYLVASGFLMIGAGFSPMRYYFTLVNEIFGFRDLEMYSEILAGLKYVDIYFSLFTLYFIFYLLICLIIVYEVIKVHSGPLRLKI